MIYVAVVLRLSLLLLFNGTFCQMIGSRNTTDKEDEVVDPLFIEELVPKNITAHGVYVEWVPLEDVNCYRIETEVPEGYPPIAPFVTSLNHFEMKNLSPGIPYSFYVNAVSNNTDGPKTNLTYTLEGDPIPMVNPIQVALQNNNMNSVKIQWDKPPSPQNISWTYGVYMGETEEQLMKGPVTKTKYSYATVTYLRSCRSYLFSVSIVGPVGYGPISKNYLRISTAMDRLAPPKNVVVRMHNESILRMVVEWESGCPNVQEPIGYYIVIKECVTSSATVMTVDKSWNTTFERQFKTAYGGMYDVKVSTDEPQASPSPKIRFQVPHFLQPYNVQVTCDNRTFEVSWREPEIPPFLGKYKYEVLASEGEIFSNIIRFDVSKPPFTFKYGENFDNYTFAVVLKTESRLRSTMSEQVTCYKLKTEEC